MSVHFHNHLDENSVTWENRLKLLTHRYAPALVFLLALVGIFFLSRGGLLEGSAAGGASGHSSRNGSWLQQTQSDPSGEMLYEDPSSEAGDGYLHFTINKGEQSVANVQALLKRYCRRVNLVSQRFQENGVAEIVYRLVLSDPSYSDDLVEQLESLSGISQITFMLHEEQGEV